jgi:hypothetical protein
MLHIYTGYVYTRRQTLPSNAPSTLCLGPNSSFYIPVYSPYPGVEASQFTTIFTGYNAWFNLCEAKMQMSVAIQQILVSMII